MTLLMQREIFKPTFKETVQEIKEYISGRQFENKLTVHDEYDSFVAFEHEPGLFLASASETPVHGSYGYYLEVM